MDFESKFTWISKNVEERTGWKPEEFIGHSVLEFVPPEYHEEMINSRDNRALGETQEYRTKVYRKDTAIDEVVIRIRHLPKCIVGSIDRRLEDRQWIG